MILLLSVAVAAEPLFVADATGPITIDGVLDEESWALAAPADDFVRNNPSAGGPAPGHTEVRFVQDERALYVGMRVTESEAKVRARISAREEINSDDQIGVYLDTFHDRRSGYIFYLNPLGIQQDIRHNAGNWNPNWDTTLRSARVELEVTTDSQPNVTRSAVGRYAVKFDLGFFSTPMIDNTRLSNDQRVAVVLTDKNSAGASLSLVYFPGSRASLREKPYYEEILKKLADTVAAR